MKNKKLLFALLLIAMTNSKIYSQAGINTAAPHPSAVLDIHSSNKGLLISRVPLQSINDTTTLSNPQKGMLVIASSTAGSGSTKITAGALYKFDGTIWEELLENGTNSENFLYPTLVAIARKTSSTTCTGLTSKNFELSSPFTAINGNSISETGALTAGKSGYYSWSLLLKQFTLKGAYNPVIFPGMMTYAFQSGSATDRAWQITNFSGAVYLNEGQTSQGFAWELGGTCVAEDRIGEQQVTWTYMGE